MAHPRHPDRPNLAIVIAAAGCGGRFGSDKMSEQVGGRTVLETAVSALRTAIPTAPMVVVVTAENLEALRATLEADSPMTVVIAGGARRQDSVRLGVERAVQNGAEIVAIHDGARPLVHPDDIRRVIEGLGDTDAAVLGEPVPDTVKRIDASGTVLETVDRGSLRRAQTPQIVRVSVLHRAWEKQNQSLEWSDEAAVIEADGGAVRVIDARHPNPKITTAADLELVRILSGGGS